MKKRSFIGVSCGILVLFAIIGIASLPDEVLTESSAVKELQIVSQEDQLVHDESYDFTPSTNVQKNIDSTNAELVALKKEITELKNELVQLKTNSQTPEQTLPIAQANDLPEEDLNEEPKEDSEEKTIKIRLNDGVGTDMR